jgi:hypothetical protein
MSHLRHSGSGPAHVAATAAADAAAAVAALGPLTPRSAFVALPEIDAGSSTFATDFSGALGLHISSSSSFDHSSPSSSSPSTSASSSTPYSPPAVISLGEEWTDEDTTSDRSASLDVFGDSGSYFAFSPSTSSSLSLSPELTTEQLPLWQAEHARLLSIRDAVLSSERAARYREACLESEVARIKDDLARVKESRARARWLASRAGSGPGSSSRRNSAPDASQGARPAATPLVRRASDSDVPAAVHHRATETEMERQWNQHSSGWFSGADDDDEQITLDHNPPIPAESLGQFWDEDYPDPEMMLAYNLTEARSARAEERRRRKRDHERIRELGILLSLGSEVRQWEERLAWENAFQDSDPMELDHIEVEDAASRRRSKSLPTTPASDGSSLSSSSSALTPPLPPLSASPLWRVSAEMILRRRSLSERPRRGVTPLIALPFTQESEVADSASTDFGSSGGSGSGSGSSAKHQAVPPPISITPPGVASSLKTAPSRPSALKLSFTLEDLVAPEEAAVVEKIEERTRQDEEMCNSSEESSDASDSDDSRCKSSSSNSSSSENENEREGEKRLALRRGRSRWSWRRSLQSAQQLQLQQQLQQIVVDMEVDDA